jgi:hypothetical protein
MAVEDFQPVFDDLAHRHGGVDALSPTGYSSTLG